MFTIKKQFHFSASHYLNDLPEDHPCSRIHGHNYIVTVELQSATLTGAGFVVDYRYLANIKEWLDSHFDHRHLNDSMEGNPTAENIAKHLFLTFKQLHPLLSAVEVSETDKTSARYEPNYDTR